MREDTLSDLMNRIHGSAHTNASIKTINVVTQAARPYTITVIGGGASGVSVVNSLVEELTKEGIGKLVQINIVERTGEFGQGDAFGTKNPEHILNVPSGGMSAIPGSPDNFTEYLNNRDFKNPGGDNSSQMFPPRDILGGYLEELLRNCEKKAIAENIRIEKMQCEVVEIERARQSDKLVLDSGGVILTDITILCLGNQPPTNFLHLEQSDRYIPHAWPATRIVQSIPSDATVGVLGSGLTGVDSVITLHSSGHVGPISLVSRSGTLPRVRPSHFTARLETLRASVIEKFCSNVRSNLTLEVLGTLINIEAASHNLDLSIGEYLGPRKQKTPAMQLTEDLQAAKLEEARFAIIKGIDDISGDLWRKLSLESKREFISNWRSHWRNAAYPMPHKNALLISRLLETPNRLQVLGGFRHTQVTDRGFRLHFLADGKPTKLDVDYLINSTGQSFELSKMPSRLIRSLYNQGLLTELEILPGTSEGANVTYETGQLINCVDEPVGSIYLVGPLSRGVHFYTNSVSENARRAQRTACHVVSTLKADIMQNAFSNRDRLTGT